MTAPCVVDTSALVAISQNEPDGKALLDLISRQQRIVLPATAYLEFTIVTKDREVGRSWLDSFISWFQVEIHAISSMTVGLAADAFTRFGKGTGHPARLNFGDCLSYATALELDASLLFKGTDFAHTDVKRTD
jgi:ribonuclease VapC